MSGWTIKYKKGKETIIDLDSIDSNTICQNIKNMAEDYEEQIADLKQKIEKLESNKEYTNLITENKKLQDKYYNNSIVPLTDNEVKAIKNFKDKHYKKCAEKKLNEIHKSGGHFPVNGPSLGSTYIYTIIGTSMGSIIKIKCPICNCEEDITDQEKF